MTARGKGGPTFVAQGELVREAARVFPRLVNDRGYIESLNETSAVRVDSCGVFTRRNDYRRAVLRLDLRIVEAFRNQGWIELSGDRYVLADAGLLWLRRHRAGAEPYLRQHQLPEQTEREISGVRRPVIVNEGESPLGWLRRRKDRNGAAIISSAQFEAGERLRAEYERAQLMPKLTSNWESAVPSRRMRRAAPEGPAALSDQALASRENVAAALDAVGPELSGILVDVCCHLVGLTEAEKCRGWPQRSGKVILQIALTRLARHYGLEDNEKVLTESRPRMRHWGADGFRPSLDRWT